MQQKDLIYRYEFSDSLPAHKKFVYKDDLEMLLSDMNKNGFR